MWSAISAFRMRLVVIVLLDPAGDPVRCFFQGPVFVPPDFRFLLFAWRRAETGTLQRQAILAHAASGFTFSSDLTSLPSSTG